MQQLHRTPRTDRWQALVSAAFLLEECLAGAVAEARLAEARATLDSLLEVFTADADPLDDFEGYAVRRLALALRRSLDVAP